MMKKLLLLVISCLFISLSAAPQAKLDSLLQLFNKATEKQKTNLLLELSFITRNDTTASNSYAHHALKLAEKQNQLPEKAKANYYLGETNYYIRNFSGAIPHYKKAISLYELLKDSFNLTNCYTSTGLCYHNIDQGEKAIAQFIEGLKLSENNQEYKAEILHNIGNVQQKMQNFQKAIDYFRKAMKINLSIKDSVSLAVNYNGLAESFQYLHKNDSSIVYFLKANQLFKKLHKTGYQAITLSNLGTIYTNYPDSLKKASDAFSGAWMEFQKLGWNHYESEIKEGFGNILSSQGKYKEAIAAYTESMRSTERFNRGFSLKKSTYQKMAKAYESIGDYKSALKYHVLYAQYSDSLNQKEKYEKLVSIEKQYETEKKENEIYRLQVRQELTDVQLRKNKQLKILGFVTASLLLIFVFFVLIRYYDKNKLNQLLELKNKKIEQSENELKVLNASKNKFFSIIAHDLKNPFHTVMGYSWLLSKDYERFTKEERRKFASDIHHSTNNIFRLLQNLLEWSKSQTGRLTVMPREIEFKQIIDSSVSVLRSLADKKNIGIKFDYNDDLILYVDPLMIETVLRNLINNAIKFTPEDGLIEVTANQIDGQICICVKDSGIGISQEDALNLFRIDSTVKRKGTNNEDGSGLGLILCKEFVDKNNGTIWVKSSLGEGSSFFFTVPAKTGESHQSIEND
jgi:signal transduction histidine kinase